jgi:stage II sporulation protein GA (sporulation sigma-E factor processing peptidase)
MVIYADVLIVLNLIVDYFLVLASSKIIGKRLKTFRILLSSLIGAISSLYIFLPQLSVVWELAFKAVICLLMSATAFGIRSIKQFLKGFGVLFIITCSYAGIMMALWHIFKPYGMVINNSVVYFDISPLVLIGSTVIFYVLFVVLSHIFKSSSKTAERCEIVIESDGKSEKLSAILDTGNSVVDLFGNCEIIIADKRAVKRIFGDIEEAKERSKNRYRVVPYSSVSGADILDGFRCDKASVSGNSKTVLLQKPILAVAKTPLNDGYNAIVNPKILD